MTNLKKITQRLVAAKAASDDAKTAWDAVLDVGGTVASEAKRSFDDARRQFDGIAREFNDALYELKTSRLLALSIDMLDGETLSLFKRMVAYLRLDSYTEPAVNLPFDDAVFAWIDAREWRDVLKEMLDGSQSNELPAFRKALDELAEHPDQEPHLQVIWNRARSTWQFMFELLGEDNQGADEPLEQEQLKDDAAQKLYNRSRAELDAAEGALAYILRNMSVAQYRQELASLPEDVSLKLVRAVESGMFPSPVAMEQQMRPQAQAKPQTRVEVATMVKEEEETAEDVGLDPNFEADLDQFLRDLNIGGSGNGESSN